MTYILNPNLSIVRNHFNKKTYLSLPGVNDSVINDDAFRIISGEISNWQRIEKFQDFFRSSLEHGWIVKESNYKNENNPIIREINYNYHLRRVQIESILQCNLTCAHCYCSSSPTAPAGFSTAEFKKLLEELATMGVLTVDFTGGEPLLRKDIFDLIKYTRELGMAATLFSNGLLITKEIATKIKDYGVSRVQVSLDAFTPEIHNKIRGHAKAFQMAVDGIRNLKNADVNTSINIMVNKLNAHEIKELTDFIEHDLKVSFTLDRIIPSGRALDTEDLALSNEEFYSLIRKTFPLRENLTSKICDTANPTVSQVVEPGCGAGASYCFIKYDGTVVLCPTLTENEGQEFKSKRFQESSMKEIWLKHPTFVRFRGMQCENVGVCPVSSSCRGGCRSNAYLLHGHVNAPDEMSCNFNKNSGSDYVPFLELYKKKIYTLATVEA